MEHENKIRKGNMKEQQQALEDIMRNETGKYVDGFEKFRRILQERAQANGENLSDVYCYYDICLMGLMSSDPQRRMQAEIENEFKLWAILKYDKCNLGKSNGKGAAICP